MPNNNESGVTPPHPKHNATRPPISIVKTIALFSVMCIAITSTIGSTIFMTIFFQHFVGASWGTPFRYVASFFLKPILNPALDGMLKCAGRQGTYCQLLATKHLLPIGVQDFTACSTQMTKYVMAGECDPLEPAELEKAITDIAGKMANQMLIANPGRTGFRHLCEMFPPDKHPSLYNQGRDTMEIVGISLPCANNVVTVNQA